MLLWINLEEFSCENFHQSEFHLLVNETLLRYKLELLHGIENIIKNIETGTAKRYPNGTIGR